MSRSRAPLLQNRIDHLLFRHPVLDVEAEPHQLLTVRVGHFFEIRGVDLRMSAKKTKVAVEKRGVEIQGQSLCHLLRQALSPGMKVIQVVFKTNEGRSNPPGIVYGRHDAPPLLLRRKPFCKHIIARRHQQILRFRRKQDGVGLFPGKRGPLYETVLEMAGVDEGRGALFRLRAQMLPRAKIDDTARGNVKAQKERRQISFGTKHGG